MQLTSTEAEHVAKVMSALSTTSRVLILARLVSGPSSVGELVDELEMSQASVSNHLRILRHLDLVVGDREGRRITYRLQDGHVRSMIEEMLDHVRHV